MKLFGLTIGNNPREGLRNAKVIMLDEESESSLPSKVGALPATDQTKASRWKDFSARCSEVIAKSANAVTAGATAIWERIQPSVATRVPAAECNVETPDSVLTELMGKLEAKDRTTFDREVQELLILAQLGDKDTDPSKIQISKINNKYYAYYSYKIEGITYYGQIGKERIDEITTRDVYQPTETILLDQNDPEFEEALRFAQEFVDKDTLEKQVKREVQGLGVLVTEDQRRIDLPRTGKPNQLDEFFEERKKTIKDLANGQEQSTTEFMIRQLFGQTSHAPAAKHFNIMTDDLNHSLICPLPENQEHQILVIKKNNVITATTTFDLKVAGPLYPEKTKLGTITYTLTFDLTQITLKGDFNITKKLKDPLPTMTEKEVAAANAERPIPMTEEHQLALLDKTPFSAPSPQTQQTTPLSDEQRKWAAEFLSNIPNE